MFARGHIYALFLAFALVALALSTARPSRGASPEARHLVRSGETLWSIASARYAGDPRAATAARPPSATSANTATPTAGRRIKARPPAPTRRAAGG